MNPVHPCNPIGDHLNCPPPPSPPHAPLSSCAQVGAVIVSPTRELAKQIFEVAQPYLLGVCAAGPMLLVGGSNPQDDVLQFKEEGANVLVGTPGRLDDIMVSATNEGEYTCGPFVASCLFQASDSAVEAWFRGFLFQGCSCIETAVPLQNGEEAAMASRRLNEARIHCRVKYELHTFARALVYERAVSTCSHLLHGITHWRHNERFTSSSPILKSRAS